MRDSKPEKGDSRGDLVCGACRYELEASNGISLVHEPTVHEGKTGGMAKGLFLSCRGVLCAGESAGLGLPVWKAGGRTWFPTLISMESIGCNALTKDYRMDRVVAWRISGKKAPAWFDRAMELLVDRYMKMPSLQQRLLRFRDSLRAVCPMDSSMAQGSDQGICRVRYEVRPQGMAVQADAEALHGQGRLIMLNELDGVSFNRVRMPDAVLTDGGIPAWREAPPDTVLESGSRRIGISLSADRNGDPGGSSLYCGREVADGLNWAGLALVSPQRFLSYRIDFHTV